MQIVRLIAAGLVALSLTACIGTSGNVVRPNTAASDAHYWYSIQNDGAMTTEGLAVLKAQLDRRFAGVRAQDMAPGALQVKIQITSYRMRHGAARATVGIMAGTDHINSNVSIVDPATGDILGTLTVESKNQTAIGSAGGLLEGHADEIADFVLRAK